ncbi:hypothetical protein N0V93_006081 [Gnomoniopsis smithogilvyi]|uniref:Ketoreductase domain-containing protein n=1 Tax=Gnomoniopsis smithogilvyi TaxID=1191159 RepID=A0A9W8YP06_9PEZI|nr:hypothetical protein N0V93_006081 [Gnomoniopsis smithogilvyi]
MTSAAPSLSLTGKVVIVTGASRGIGAGIAMSLAERGAKLALVYTSESSIALTTALADKINNLGTGAQAITVRADSRDLSSPAKIVSETRAAFGDTIHVLVNNAGHGEAEQPLEKIDVDAFNRMFEINVRGPLFLTQAVQPHLPSHGGRIIFISSIGAQIGVPGVGIYNATKGALNSLTRTLSNELAPKGHTVNAVSPGPTESDMFRKLPQDVIDSVLEQTPAGRVGTADDIGAVVGFLAEEQSRWVTGQILNVAGGLV